MSKLDRGLPEWASYLLKALFVMIFPLHFSFSDPLQILVLPSTGLLFPSQYYGAMPELVVDNSYAIYMLSSVLRNFIVGIIIASPGIYFNYKLARTSLNKSSWIRGIGLSAAIYFLTFGVMLFLTQFMYSPFPEYYQDTLWDLSNKLGYYPTLVMGVFIILPLVLRQAVIISVPSDLHDYSVRDIESTPKFNLSREKILSAILWLTICFAPYVFQLDYGWYNRGYMWTSFLIDYRFGENWYYYIDTMSLVFDGNFALFFNIPFFAILFAFNFAFVRDVYRYLRKTITRSRLVGMAVFSGLFPFIAMLGMGGIASLIAGMYMLYLPIPLPILQIVGFLLVRYHRPQIVQSERVWKGERTRMWWETDEKRREEPAPVVNTTPEKPKRHREEVITVPIRYRFLSRIRNLKSRNQSQHEEVF